jgi:glucosamine-phosphate N-acetyltransferase
MAGDMPIIENIHGKTPMFDPSYISPDVLKELPEGYTMRPLQRNDYHKGFLDVLRVLTTVGDVNEEVRSYSRSAYTNPLNPFLLLPRQHHADMS